MTVEDELFSIFIAHFGSFFIFARIARDDIRHDTITITHTSLLHPRARNMFEFRAATRSTLDLCRLSGALVMDAV